MEKLREGMTQAQFLTALNNNFAELTVIRDVGAYPTILSSDDYVSLINSNYGSTEVSVGMRGIMFKNALDNVFYYKDWCVGKSF
jgi:hypothetical protein